MTDKTFTVCALLFVASAYGIAHYADSPTPNRQVSHAVQICVRMYGPATQPVYINNVLTCQSRRGETLEAK